MQKKIDTNKNYSNSPKTGVIHVAPRLSIKIGKLFILKKSNQKRFMIENAFQNGFRFDRTFQIIFDT